MTADAVLGATPSADVPDPVLSVCKCGEKIMFSSRVPPLLPRICVSCAADLFRRNPRAIVVAPSGLGFISSPLNPRGIAR
jgi:hypothetical protein